MITSSSTVEVDGGAMGAVEAFTGTQLPRANVPMLLTDAGTMNRLADVVRNLLAPQLIQTIAAVSTAVGGDTAAQFVAQTAPFVAADPNTLLQMAALQDDIAEAMRGYAVEMDYTVRQALIMFIFMMIELAIAAAEAFFAPEDAIERVATTRTIIQTVLRSSLTKMIARSTAIQMLFMPGSSLLAQLSQMANGIRSGVDWGEVGKQALYGLAVAALSTVAGPAMGRASKAFNEKLETFSIKESVRNMITKLTMDPVFEVTMEIGGGAGAALIVDHKYDPSNAKGDGESGALEGGGEKAAEHVGLGARRGAHGLGFTPSFPHLKMPGGSAFSVTGKPVLPVSPVTDRSVTPDPLADVPKDPAPPYSALTKTVLGPDGPTPLPAPTVPLAPVPTWVAAGPNAEEMTGQWSQFQQELAAQYGTVLAEAAQIRDVIAALPQSVAQAYATWLADPAVTSFLSELEVPRAALNESIVESIRDRAVDQVITEAARTTVLSGQVITPEQIAAALPVAFDQQALRTIGQIAAQEQITRYVAAQPSVLPVVSQIVAPQLGRQIDQGMNALLGGPTLPSASGVVPVRVSATTVTAVASVVRQATGDLPAQIAAAAPPGTPDPATVTTPAAAFELHVSAATTMAQTQFTALSNQYAADPGVHAQLAETYQKDWLGGYRQSFAPTTATTPGTVEIDAERWRPTGDAFDVSGGTVTRPIGGGERVAVRYALTPNPDEWVFQVRLHLTGGPGVDLAAVQEATQAGVAQYLNAPRSQLPTLGAALRVDVQFVDDPAQAHATVTVDGTRTGTDQVNWKPGESPATYAHEVLHFLGVTDRPTGGDPALMGHHGHDHDGDLPISDNDLQQIVDTLAPHYAGVVGSHGPAIRPTGAASAAHGPTGVAAAWATGTDTPPKMAPSTSNTGPDPVFTVPSDGYCLLYAFIATNPAAVLSTLGASLPNDLRQFLSDPARVRTDMTIGHVGLNTPAGRVSQLLQAHVGRYLRANRTGLAGDVTRQRVHFDEVRFAEVATLSHRQVIGRLRGLVGTDVTDVDYLDVGDIQRRYDHVRSGLRIAGQQVGPATTRAQEQLDFLTARSQGFQVTDLTPAMARGLLVDALIHTPRPLDDGEFTRVRDAVDNWANDWNTPAGEFLGPLLAHATGTQLTVLRSGPLTPTLAAGTYGPAGGVPVTLYHVAADPARPTTYNHYNASAPAPAHPGHSTTGHTAPLIPPLVIQPSTTTQPATITAPANPTPAPVVPTGPPADALLNTMATTLPAHLRLQRAIGATLLHGDHVAPGPISTQIPAPIGPGPAILLHQSALDPTDIAATLAGLRAQDTTMAVLHWPAETSVTVDRAHEITTQALSAPASSAMLLVPRAALTERPQPDPRIIPLDANGEVTFFSGRPERYLFLPSAPGAAALPYGRPTVSRDVHQLSDGWVIWDGGSHLWIGPSTELARVQAQLPGTGSTLPEPPVLLGWGNTAMPPGVRDQLGPMFAAMPAGSTRNLITSGVGLDRRNFPLDDVANLPDGVELAHVPGGILAYTGKRPAGTGAPLSWSDLTDPDRPRLVLHDSVTDPVGVVDAVDAVLRSTDPARADRLQVFLTPSATAAPAGSPAATVAAQLRTEYGGTLDLVLPVAALGRTPAGGDLIPIDARGQETFPEAATAFRVRTDPLLALPPRPLGLAPAASGVYQVHDGWTVTSHRGVVLFAERGTRPDTLPADAFDAPAHGVAVVIQSRGGAIPREVAATAERLLSGVPEADRHIRVHGNPGSAGPAAAVPIADATGALATGLSATSTPPFVPPAVPDRLALALGIPKAALPGIAQLGADLHAEAARRGVTVTAKESELLHQQLLNNYTLLVSPDGYLFTLGRMELKVRLNPDDPRLAPNPAGSSGDAAPGPSVDDEEGRSGTEDGRFHANQFTQGVFQTGAHGQGDNTTMRANRVRGELGADIPLGPTTHYGVKASGVINRIDQSSSHLIDAEKGRVLDTRADSTFYSYRPVWSAEARVDGTAWQPVALTVPKPDDPRLVLAIPNHLLGTAGEQVVADLPEDLRPNLNKLPETFSASNITGLSTLYDQILDRLREDGYKVPIGSQLRQELQGKLWNLETHFDEAVNKRRGDAPADTRGYRFTLHENGDTAATIRVYAHRHGNSIRVGATSNEAHIEKVRTAIVGHGNNYSLQQSSGLSVGAGADLPMAPGYGKAETFKDKASLSVGGHVGVSFNSNDNGGATGASLAVKVSRYTGETSGHRADFALSADVATRRKPMEGPRRTRSVRGSAVVRITEPDALAYGFGVDADAFRPDPNAPPPSTLPPAAPPVAGTPRRVAYQEWVDRLRNRGPHPEDVGGNVLPQHVLDGHGLGQSLADVDPDAVARFKADLARELTRKGFLPRDEERPWSHLTSDQGLSGKVPAPTTVGGNVAEAGRAAVDGARLQGTKAVDRDVDAAIDNLDLFDKLVSTDGVESHFDTLLQDGMTFTLNTSRNGVMSTAEVTVTARSRNTGAIDPDTGNSEHYDRMTDELHIVNLIMGLGIAGQGSGGTQGVSLDFGLKANMPPSVPVLGSVDFLGAAFSRNVGATDRLTRILNRPELLEYPGRVKLFNLLYDLNYSVRYSDSTVATSKKPVSAPVRAALLDLNTDPSTFSEVAPTDTDASVLDQAVIYHLNTQGMRGAATGQLPGLTAPGAPMTQPLNSMTNQIAVQAHLKEAVLGQYSTDALVQPHLVSNTNAAMSINVSRIGGAQFVGATPDKYVAGLIELYLAETSNTANRSSSTTINLPDINLGKKWGKFGLNFSESLNVKSSESEAEETKRVGGLEMLKLAFSRAYAFKAPVDFNVRSGTSRQVGFLWGKTDVPAGADLLNQDMIFLLPEPDALAQYAAGRLPISDVQLHDAMSRWARGELVISGNTVAGLLSRWHQAIAARTPAGETPNLATYLTQQQVTGWARTLASRHGDATQRGAVLDPVRRQQLLTDFNLTLDPNVNPFSSLTVPQYMNRTGDRTLGHAAGDKVTLFTAPAPADGTPRPTTSLLQAVRDQIDAVTPGLLGTSHADWGGVGDETGILMVGRDRKVIGTLPGGLETLQHTLAGQRSNVLLADMLHKHLGVTFYLVNRRGGVLADVLEVKLTARLDGKARYVDWVPEYGIENYGHAYNSWARTIGRSLGWNLMPAKFGFSVDGKPIGGDASLSYAPQGGRSHKAGFQGTREQTVYDWSGHYLARDGATIDIETTPLKMDGRPLNNLALDVLNSITEAYDKRGKNPTPTPPTKVSYPSQIDFKIPRGLAEATPGPAPSPLDLRPLPPLPGDVYVSGALVDDLYPMARELMGRLLGSHANDPAYRGSVALAGLLSRLNVDNHLPDALGDDGYLLAPHLFVAGSSNHRAAMRLYASLHSLEVVSKIVNATGTGRYAKFHVTNAASQSRNKWRANVDGELSVTKKHGKTHVGAQEDTTWDTKFTAGGNRTAPESRSAAFEDTERSEGHLKMQGPVYLVRLRGRFQLGGFSHRHSPFLPSRLGGAGPERFGADTKSTGWLTGDVYVEMFADEVHELQRQMKEPHDWAAAAPGTWPAPAPTATTTGLEGLLVRTTPAAMAAAPVAGRDIDAGTFDPGQAAGHAALLIRDQLNNRYDPVDPIRLTASALEQARQRYRTVLDWAVQDWGATHGPSLTVAQQATAGLTQLATWRAAPTPPALTIDQLDQRVDQIMDQITRAHPIGTAPAGPVEALTMLGQNPVTVARGVAFELNTYVDLRLTDDQGTPTNYRIDPQGRVVELVPNARGVLTAFTAADAEASLTADLVRRADEAGIDAASRGRVYDELLGRTALQPEAAAALAPELEERILAARDAADDGARAWLAASLPHRSGPSSELDAHRDHGDSPDIRAARARRLLTRNLALGWGTVGPLRQVPNTLRPGTHLWVARPQGAIAARLQSDGTYQVHDPLLPGPAGRTLTAAQFQAETATAQAVTLIEPDVLASWLTHNGDLAASRQYAEANLPILQADQTAAALANAEHQARIASSAPAQNQAAPNQAAPALGPGDPVLNLHHALLASIRAGQTSAAYRYLTTDLGPAGPASAHRVVIDAAIGLIPAPAGPGQPVTPNPSAPAALRAFADLIEADPRLAANAAYRTAATSDASVLRALAAVLDPSVPAVSRFMAIVGAARGINNPASWNETLRDLADELDGPVSEDVALLRSALDVNHRMTARAIGRLVDGLTPAERAEVTTAAAAAGMTATDLARQWNKANTSDQLLTMLPKPGNWAGTTTAAAITPHHDLPPGDRTLDDWMDIDDLPRSRTFLDTHRPQLLSDRSHANVQAQRARQPDDTRLATREALLTMARYGRVDDAYHYLTGPTPGAPATVPVAGAPTARQQLLLHLLARPDLADPAAVSALAQLAGSLTGPTDITDGAILHTTADLLAGLPVDSDTITDLVRTARETHSVLQREQWATAIRTLGDRTAPGRGPALRDLADRLSTRTPVPLDPATAATPRQNAREDLVQAIQALQRTTDDLEQARVHRTQAQAAQEDVEERLTVADTQLDDAVEQREEATVTIDRRNRELPDLREQERQAQDLVDRAEQRIRDLERARPPGQTTDTPELTTARSAVGPLGPLTTRLAGAQRDLRRANDDIRTAGITRDQLDLRIPGLRRHLGDLQDEHIARQVGFRARKHAVTTLEQIHTDRQTARDRARTHLAGIRLTDPPDVSGVARLDVDVALADIARSGYAATAVLELANRIRAQHGSGLPDGILLTATSGRPAPTAPLPPDEAAAYALDRVHLARDLAAMLRRPVELRIVGGPTSQRAPYLAYPGGEVVRLTADGRPENLTAALTRLSPQLRADLGVNAADPEVRFRLEALHEAEIESLHDFEANVTALVERVNRHQGQLAYRWITHPNPPSDSAGTRPLSDGLSTEVWPATDGPVDANSPEGMAAAWLASTPAQRATLMAGLLAAAPDFGFTAQPPVQTRPADLPPGTRLLVVAGGTVRAAVVLPTTQLGWYEPGRNEIGTGSMRMLGTWAVNRVGGPAGQADVWYIVLVPNP